MPARLPRHRSILDTIAKIEPAPGPSQAPAEPLTVKFTRGRTAILPPSIPHYLVYAAMLAELMALKIPVYVTMNAKRQITRLLIPASGRVVGLIRDKHGAVGFRLDSSAQAFSFDNTLAGYRSFVRVLQDAQLDQAPVQIVQDDIGTSILDINRPDIERNSDSTPVRAVQLVGPPNPETRKVSTSIRTVTSIPQVTMARARELFNLVRRGSCDPSTPTEGCIPFLYLRDGCHVRAHEMCRLLRKEGAYPGKVWNYSNNLTFKTPNEPKCEAIWSFHVAPTLHVTSGRHGFQLQVLDPSLFPKPVSVKAWRHKQGDTSSILVHTGPDPLFPPAAGDIEIDPDFSETKRLLNIYRMQFQLRVLQQGAPPYCPKK